MISQKKQSEKTNKGREEKEKETFEFYNLLANRNVVKTPNIVWAFDPTFFNIF